MLSPAASATSRAPNKRPTYGSCGFATASSPNILPVNLGASQAPAPTLARIPIKALLLSDMSPIVYRKHGSRVESLERGSLKTDYDDKRHSTRVRHNMSTAPSTIP